MKSFPSALSAALMIAVALPAAEPAVLLFDAVQLARVRSGEVPAALAWIRAEADPLLEARPPTVLDKTTVPASGDKHDYFSMGPYWWPDPAKPDGLPYVRRDGEVNPEARAKSDSSAFARTCRSIEILGTAYHVTGEERYAAKAAAFARTWFLDPATRMNPNFQHAQAIPGVTTGRGIGIIEGQNLMWANEGLALLAGSSAWTADDRTAMHAWNEAFYLWLTTSKNGLDEKAWHNNHGTWYDAQVAHLALVLGRRDEARGILADGLNVRLAKHVEPDGRQPHELERTRSLGYSIYNLEALFVCARLAERVGVDWWRFSTSDGRSLGAALRFIAPYVDPAKPWIKTDLGETNRARIIPLLRQYLQRCPDAELQALLDAALSRGAPDQSWRALADELRG